RPDKALISGEDGFRFRHLLIRDAAYDALPKATRSELHERFALWLEQHGREMVELDEIVGYHLEQAVRYREELGQLDEAARSLAVEAAGRLERAGRRARNRYDVGAVVNLLGRAAALLPDGGEARASILPQLGEAYLQAGELERGERTLREAVGLAEKHSN